MVHMLMRFDPYREADRLMQALGQEATRSRPTTMAMDAYRDGDELVVHFDLPGVDPKSIDLTVEKNVLTVRAERSWQPNEGQEILVNERVQGTFTRQLFLGDSLDADRIQATYENGVLTARIPVAAQAKPRKVQISTTGSGGEPIESKATESDNPTSREPQHA
jgi:HSP20 family protein